MSVAKVSVIIPARNASATIVAAVDSALSQTLKPLEVIVVDDQSSDDTAKLALGLGSGVHVIKGEGLGSGPARNLGVNAARGEVIAFLDADDIWNGDKLEKQLPSVAPNVIVGSYAKYFVTGSPNRIGTSIRTKNDEEALQFVLDGKGMPLLLSSFVMLKADFLRLGGFDPEYVRSQDYEFLVRACVEGFNLRIVRKELLSYRLHTESDTLQFYVEQYLTGLYVRLKYFATAPFPLESWLRSSQNDKKLLKRAIGGRQFRKGVVNIRTQKRFLGFLQIIHSCILDPRRFAEKIYRQSNFGLRKGKN